MQSLEKMYKVTLVVLDKLSIQGRYGSYIGPEPRAVPKPPWSPRIIHIFIAISQVFLGAKKQGDMWSTHVVNAFIVKTREYKKSTKTIRHDDARRHILGKRFDGNTLDKTVSLIIEQSSR